MMFMQPSDNGLDALLKLDNQFCFALYALSRRVTALYRPLLQELGLTYPQYLVMLVLWESQGDASPEQFEGVPVKFVGERLQLDTGTLTPLLKRLESAGLLLRTRSSQDEREVLLRLTATALQLKEKARVVPLQLVCNSGIPPDRLLHLQRELQSLLALIGQDEKATSV